MTEVCVATAVPIESPLKLSAGEDRSTADQTEGNQCENGILVRQDIQNPADNVRAAANRAPARVKRATGSPADVLRALENRHRWLLFAQHCYTCCGSEQGCELGKLCTYGKKTLKHVAQCRRDDCPYPRCSLLKPLLQHSRKCQSSTCAICVPVWNYIQRDLQQQQQQQETIQQGTQPTSETQPALRGGSPRSQLQQQAAAATAQRDVPPASWVPPLVAGMSGAAVAPVASRPKVERFGTADASGDPSGGDGPQHSGEHRPGGSACCARSGPGGDLEGRLSCTGAVAQCSGGAGSGSAPGGSLDRPSGDGKPPAGKQQQQTQRAAESLQALAVTTEQVPQQVQMQQEQHPQQHPQQSVSSAIGPPPGALSSSGPHQLIGLASSSLSPYTLAPHGGSLSAPLGPPLEESPDQPKPVITITAPPPQPIPVISCAAMRPPQMGAAAPPQQQLLHSYPPSAALSHLFSHMPHLQQPLQQQQPGAALNTHHWLPVTGVAALPGVMASRGASAATLNGIGGGEVGGLLGANGAATASSSAAAATQPPPGAAATALWHNQGSLRAGPLALYGITADAVRPGGLGAVMQAGAMQSVDRYGHPYALAGMNGGGGVSGTAAGALTLATAPLLLWPGHHQPPAGAMAAGAAATVAAAAPEAAAGAPQIHAAAHLASPFTIGGPRLSGGTPALGASGGGAGPALSAASGATIHPTAHNPPHHTLLYGSTAMAPGAAAGANASVATAVGLAGSGGGGGAMPGAAEVAAGATLWSYLLR